MCRIDLFEGEARLAHIFCKTPTQRAIVTNGGIADVRPFADADIWQRAHSSGSAALRSPSKVTWSSRRARIHFMVNLGSPCAPALAPLRLQTVGLQKRWDGEEGIGWPALISGVSRGLGLGRHANSQRIGADGPCDILELCRAEIDDLHIEPAAHLPERPRKGRSRPVRRCLPKRAAMLTPSPIRSPSPSRSRFVCLCHKNGPFVC